MKTITFITKIWKWPGDMAWHFVHIPRERFEKLRKQFPKGMIHVTAIIGKTFWDTALFPHVRTKSFIMPIKQAVRKKESLWAGDEVRVKVTLK